MTKETDKLDKVKENTNNEALKKSIEDKTKVLKDDKEVKK